MTRSPGLVPIVVATLCWSASLEAQVSTSHVMAASWGQLVTNSDSSFSASSFALRGTAARFERLFRDTPPSLGILVEDSASGTSSGRAALPESRPLVVVSAATLRQAGGGAGLDTLVRVLAATTWVDEYASRWRETAVDASEDEGENVTQVPDWIRLGAVAIIADGNEAQHASEFMRTRLALALPLRSLLTIRLGSDDDLTIVGPQSASVLAYLRVLEGADGVRDLFGMLATGVNIEEALSALPRPATIGTLEAAWRRFLSAAPVDAVLPAAGVR